MPWFTMCARAGRRLSWIDHRVLGCDAATVFVVGWSWACSPMLGPAEGLLEQEEGVLQIEAAKEGLPAAVDVLGSGAGARPPEPDRLVDAAAGQLFDGEADDGGRCS